MVIECKAIFQHALPFCSFITYERLQYFFCAILLVQIFNCLRRFCSIRSIITFDEKLPNWPLIVGMLYSYVLHSSTIKKKKKKTKKIHRYFSEKWQKSQKYTFLAKCHFSWLNAMQGAVCIYYGQTF